MEQSDTKSRFKQTLLRPANTGGDAPWAFVILPENASAKLPRRGRTTIDGTLNGHGFRATLEPDGPLSHDPSGYYGKAFSAPKAADQGDSS